MSESKGTKNATGTFNIGQDAGVQVTRNDDNLESSEVGTMYLRGGRNSSIGTTSNVRDISPSAGLGLSHYKNTSTPQQRQVLGLPGIVNSSMQSEAKIPTIPMQELPLIAKQVKGPSSIQQTWGDQWAEPMLKVLDTVRIWSGESSIAVPFSSTEPLRFEFQMRVRRKNESVWSVMNGKY